MPTPLEQTELLLVTLKELLPSIARNSDKQIIAKLGKEKFAEIVEYTFDYLDRACGELKTRNEYLAMLSQVYKCLGRYMNNVQSIPVTINTLTNNIYMLEYAVDRAFPSYAQAGLLRSIISPAKLPEPIALRQAS